MVEQTARLIDFYKGWENYQKSLVETIAPLTSEQLAFPLGSHETIGELVSHMIGARYFWFHVWMGAENPDLVQLEQWDDEAAVPDAGALVAMLEITWKMIADALARWTAEDLWQEFSTPDSIGENMRAAFPPRNRQWMIWHTFEHEIHHGGELSLVLGDHGLTGVYGDF
jgi:uncharacterized damage-inducible protein DinB